MTIAGVLAAGLLAWWLYATFIRDPSPLPLPSSARTTASPAAGWPPPAGDAGATRRTSAPAALERAAPAWEVNVGAAAVVPPVADEARLYVGLQSGSFSAVDRATGAVAWSFALGAPPISAATVAGDTVFLALRSGSVVALAATDGSVRWSVELPANFFAAPLVVDGVVYAHGEGDLFGLDAADGSVLWSTHTGARRSGNAPVVAGGRLAVVGDERVLVYDLAHGNRTYFFPQAAVEHLVIEGEELFSISPAAVAALDVRSQSYWWEGFRGLWTNAWLWGVAPAPAAYPSRWVSRDRPASNLRFARDGLHTPALAADALVSANRDGLVRAFDRDTGALRWQLQLEETVAGPPLATADGILLVTDQALTLRSTDDGSELARQTLRSAESRWAIVVDRGTYVVDGDGTITAFGRE